MGTIINILTQYAEENGTMLRSTSDLSPLEEWLLNKIEYERDLYLNTIHELKLKQNK